MTLLFGRNVCVLIFLFGFLFYLVKRKCPQYSTVISGDICICNPGYYMSNAGKRTCIREYTLTPSLLRIPKFKSETVVYIEDKQRIPDSSPFSFPHLHQTVTVEDFIYRLKLQRPI